MTDNKKMQNITDSMVEELAAEKTRVTDYRDSELNDTVSKSIDRNKTKGDLSRSVGTGKYARVNIIWYIVSAIFIIYSSILAVSVIFSIYNIDTSQLTLTIKETWNIFTPILTLALGYLFGKEKSKKHNKKSN